VRLSVEYERPGTGNLCGADARLAAVEISPFRAEHLDGVLTLCVAEGWPSFPEDPVRALRLLTAPGVTTVVAVIEGDVVGFAELLSDGELQAFLRASPWLRTSVVAASAARSSRSRSAGRVERESTY
jgi:hypothetical protein